jgi:putative ABC transport system permease protein
MLRVMLRGLQGHVLRLLLTASAVMLGVSFVAGTFVLRDSIDGTLSGLVASATRGADVSVRGSEVMAGNQGTGLHPPVPLTMIPALQRVPGAAKVVPDLQGTALLAGRDGTVVRNGGAPNLAFAFVPGDAAFTLVDGHGPTAPNEVAVESVTLHKSGLKVGDRTKAVVGGDTRTVTITGEVHFGSLFGATAVLVAPGTARRLFAPDGTVSGISVTADPGVSQEDLRDSVARVLPASSRRRPRRPCRRVWASSPSSCSPLPASHCLSEPSSS